MLNKSIKIITLVFVFAIVACETKKDPDYGKPPADAADSQGDSGIDAKSDSSETGAGGTSGSDSGSGGTGGSGGAVSSAKCDEHEDCPGGACDLDAGECVTCVREGDVSIGCFPPMVCATGPSPAENRCAECVSDSDCPEGKPVCDTTRLACVICLDDEDCTDDDTSVCKQGPLSKDNECVQCEDDVDCDEGVCDGDSNKCVPCVLTDTGSRGCNSNTSPYCLEDKSDAAKNVCVQCLEQVHCSQADASYCNDSHECEPCQKDEHCVLIDGLTICDSGDCVECTDSETHCTEETSPVCDEWQCRGCESHAECDYAGGICDIATGRCYQRDEVIFVDDDGDDCPGDDGEEPYCALQTGINAITETKKTIRLEGDHAPINLGNKGEVLIVGIEYPVIGQEGNLNDSAIYLTGDTQLTIEGVLINVSRLGIGIECDGNSSDQPVLVIRDSTISNNAKEGIKLGDCIVTLEGNEITSNTGGGVSLASCDFTVTNNVIASNGAATLYGGVRITSPLGTTAVFHSNTVVGNYADGTNEAGIKCDDDVFIDSSIVFDNLSNGTEVSDECIPRYSLIEDGSGNAIGTGNIDDDPSFISEDDYHLETEEPDKSPCINTGDPSSMLTRDIEGNVRPQGGRSDMGAYEAM